MDVKEFVRVLLDLAPRCDRDILNVGPGCGKTIKELALTISHAADYAGKVVFNASRYIGIKEKFMNTDKLAVNYDIRVDAALPAGIQRTVSWYSANYPTLKNRRKFE
jgi:nucleoside-diphosphate-sugar epimerase